MQFQQISQNHRMRAWLKVEEISGGHVIQPLLKQGCSEHDSQTSKEGDTTAFLGNFMCNPLHSEDVSPDFYIEFLVFQFVTRTGSNLTDSPQRKGTPVP